MKKISIKNGDNYKDIIANMAEQINILQIKIKKLQYNLKD